jgi:hypothetical protein
MRFLKFSTLTGETPFFYWRRSILMYILKRIRAHKLAFERKDAVERETLRPVVLRDDPVVPH